jgi:hypothetical protein
MCETPGRDEAAAYYFSYIDLVPAGDVRDLLRGQADEALGLLNAITDEVSLTRYAPDKWSIREVVNHVNDTERLFTFRAFWFARGFTSPLPSFEQDVANLAAAADRRSWRGLIEEFSAVRGATIAFYDALPDEAWLRRGIASGNPFTVRALAFLSVGHVSHHLRILRARYPLAGLEA